MTPATTTVKLMSVTEDARDLSSGHPKENEYADYANKMKSLANRARKEYKATGGLKYSKDARAEYEEEVVSLLSKYNVAAMNAPRERRAQIIANSQVKAKIQDNPDMDKKEIRKASQIAINREWEAIQAGAISDTQLTNILRYADADAVKQRALPRTTTQLSPARISKINAMVASGYTNAEIAESLGVSTSTITKYTNAS